MVEHSLKVSGTLKKYGDKIAIMQENIFFHKQSNGNRALGGYNSTVVCGSK